VLASRRVASLFLTPARRSKPPRPLSALPQMQPHQFSHDPAARSFVRPASEPSVYGELQPIGGGDPIPLLKTTLIIGRRESVDIVLRFPNVSGAHCELSLVDGAWRVKDLGSSNGTKVNGVRVSEGQLQVGDKLAVGLHEYRIYYSAGVAGAGVHTAPQIDIFSRSLLASAGLESRRNPRSNKPRN